MAYNKQSTLLLGIGQNGRHRAGDDPRRGDRGRRRPLAVDLEQFAEVLLACGVVVDVVEPRHQVVDELVAEMSPDQAREEVEDRLLQLATVLGGVRLCPEEIGQIILPLLGVERQRREVADAGSPEARGERARDPDVVRGDGAADAATAAVDEEPDARRRPFALGLAAELLTKSARHRADSSPEPCLTVSRHTAPQNMVIGHFCASRLRFRFREPSAMVLRSWQ